MIYRNYLFKFILSTDTNVYFANEAYPIKHIIILRLQSRLIIKYFLKLWHLDIFFG